MSRARHQGARTGRLWQHSSMARRDATADLLARCRSSRPARRRSCSSSAQAGPGHPRRLRPRARPGGRGGRRVLRHRVGRGRRDPPRQGRPTLGPGAFFGDLALLDKAPRNATVTAGTPMELVVLGQREFGSDPRRGRRPSRASCSSVSRTASASRTCRTTSVAANPGTPPNCVVGSAPCADRSRIRSSSSSACWLRSSSFPSRRSSRGSRSGKTTSLITREVVRQHPRSRSTGSSTPPVAAMLFLCAWLISLRVQNYERGGPDDRRTTKKNVHRRLRDFRAGVWMRTLHARPRRRDHALLHLLRVPGAVRGDDHPRDRPPAAGGSEVPARQGVPGVLGDRRHRRRGVPRRHPVGDRAALHPAAVPHPHQDQARGRGDPRHVPRHRRHRLPHRGLPHRVRGPARRSRSGRSSGTRSRASSTAGRSRRSATCTARCGSCTSPRSPRSS